MPVSDAVVLTMSAANRFRGTDMKAFWVIDILKDIRQFSEKNGMMELAEQLDDAIFIAAREIGARVEGSGAASGTGTARSTHGGLADHEVH
jgi:hypothetical protein